jgi:hypothetical protein
MYSTVVENISEGEATSVIDLAIGTISGGVGSVAGTMAADEFVDDAIKQVGTFVGIGKTGAIEFTEDGLILSSRTTVIAGTIFDVTPAAQTAAYSVVDGSVGAYIEAGLGVAINYGLNSPSTQSGNSTAYDFSSRRGILWEDW